MLALHCSFNRALSTRQMASIFSGLVSSSLSSGSRTCSRSGGALLKAAHREGERGAYRCCHPAVHDGTARSASILVEEEEAAGGACCASHSRSGPSVAFLTIAAQQVSIGKFPGEGVRKERKAESRVQQEQAAHFLTKAYSYDLWLNPHWSLLYLDLGPILGLYSY